MQALRPAPAVRWAVAPLAGAGNPTAVPAGREAGVPQTRCSCELWVPSLGSGSRAIVVA